jgi:anti-sigma regulatory factor (Ser/Thr protein kinase)
LPAEPRVLVDLRRALRQWLRESGVGAHDEGEILVACGEACANVVQHAYGAGPGEMEVRARLVDGFVEMSIRDHGDWRPEAERGGGWGLQLIRGLMDSVEVGREADGTEIRMRRRVHGEVSDE